MVGCIPSLRCNSYLRETQICSKLSSEVVDYGPLCGFSLARLSCKRQRHKTLSRKRTNVCGKYICHPSHEMGSRDEGREERRFPSSSPSTTLPRKIKRSRGWMCIFRNIFRITSCALSWPVRTDKTCPNSFFFQLNRKKQQCWQPGHTRKSGGCSVQSRDGVFVRYPQTRSARMQSIG